jgi:outer membrane immunogenic protein
VPMAPRWLPLGLGVKMKTLLMTVAAVAALTAAPALAADIPRKAPPPAPVVDAYNWSGIYVGVSAGVAWGELDWLYPNAPEAVLSCSFNVVVPQQTCPNPGDLRGRLFDVHAGAQIQFGWIVLGVEGAFHFSDDFGGTATCPVPTLRCSSDIDELWTVGGRLGLVYSQTPRVMGYLSGGFASARVHTFVTGPAVAGPFELTSLRHDGWYIGTGVEGALGGPFDGWVIGFEARHYQLEERLHECVVGAIPPGCTSDEQFRLVKPEFDTVTVRLSYKLGFGGWGGPVRAAY